MRRTYAKKSISTQRIFILKTKKPIKCFRKFGFGYILFVCGVCMCVVCIICLWSLSSFFSGFFLFKTLGNVQTNKQKTSNDSVFFSFSLNFWGVLPFQNVLFYMNIMKTNLFPHAEFFELVHKLKIEK